VRRAARGLRCVALAGACLLAILGVAPVGGQDNATAPTMQDSSTGTEAVPLPDPVLLAPASPGKPEERPADPFLAREKVKDALLKPDFSYNENKLVDPFVSFLAPAGAPTTRLPLSEEDLDLPPEPKRPLTPLQKMNLGEIEKGLKAIVWGEFGRKAMVEDSAGRGYIVGVGTPVGEKEGIITDIFNDSLVVQQQVWDSRLKRMMPQNSVVKLKKQPPPK